MKAVAEESPAVARRRLAEDELEGERRDEGAAAGRDAAASEPGLGLHIGRCGCDRVQLRLRVATAPPAVGRCEPAPAFSWRATSFAQPDLWALLRKQPTFPHPQAEAAGNSLRQHRVHFRSLPP